MVLATQSIKELQESGMLQIVSESCPTKTISCEPGDGPARSTAKPST